MRSAALVQADVVPLAAQVRVSVVTYLKTSTITVVISLVKWSNLVFFIEVSRSSL